MTKQQAIEYVRSHDDDDDMDDGDLSEAFVALYGSEPSEDEMQEGVWSHLCAHPAVA